MITETHLYKPQVCDCRKLW